MLKCLSLVKKCIKENCVLLTVKPLSFSQFLKYSKHKGLPMMYIYKNTVIYRNIVTLGIYVKSHAN